MLKATLRHGKIVPLEPVPSDWVEGARLEVDIVLDGPATLDIDEWAREMDLLCADSEASDEATMRRVIEEHREQAKAQIRREMGQSG